MNQSQKMKKLLLGIAWQTLGFLGAIIILCSAASHQWDYHGITGIVGSLFGLQLIVPFVVCLVLFVLGLILTYKGLKEK